MSGFLLPDVDYGALADELDISDITSDEGNANILRRLKDDNPDFVQLHVRESIITRREFEYVLEDARSMGVLGHHLGKCTHVGELFITLSEGVNVDVIAPFLSGLKRNRSIEKVCLWHSHLPSGFFRMLTPFFRGNPNLVGFSVEGCPMDVEQYRALSSALREGTSLKEFRIYGLVNVGRYNHEKSIIENIEALKVHPQLEDLQFWRFALGRNACAALSDLLRHSVGVQKLHLVDNNISDSGVEALVDGLAHCQGLRRLDLSRNPSITVRGWLALAILLEDPDCSLRVLNLMENGIDDESATIIANALENNSTLDAVYLYDNDGITSEGWKEAFSKVLCDTSSVNSTFLSNHTLQYFNGPGDDDLPDDLAALLALNDEDDKKRVAFRKVLSNHDEFDMQPLFEWDMKVLPLVAGWLERAAAYEIECEVRTERRKLAAIYQFVRGMPGLAIEGILGVNKKSTQKGGEK